MLQKSDAFHLPFTLGRRGIDLPRARSKTCQEVQGSLAGVLVFDPDGLARLCGQGWGLARPWRATGFLVHAQHHFPYPRRASPSKVLMCCSNFEPPSRHGAQKGDSTWLDAGGVTCMIAGRQKSLSRFAPACRTSVSPCACNRSRSLRRMMRPGLSDGILRSPLLSSGTSGSVDSRMNLSSNVTWRSKAMTAWVGTCVSVSLRNTNWTIIDRASSIGVAQVMSTCLRPFG